MQGGGEGGGGKEGLTSGLGACPIRCTRWADNEVVVLTVGRVVRKRIAILVSVHIAAVTSTVIHERSRRAGTIDRAPVTKVCIAIGRQR